MTLFDDDVGRAPAPSTRPTPLKPLEDGDVVVRVLPDVAAMDRELDYVLPARLAEGVSVGSVVRVPLHGRRVRGWVVELDVPRDPSMELLEVAAVGGLALDEASIDIARWVAWRWVGRLARVLGVATPERRVHAPSSRAARRAQPTRPGEQVRGGTFDAAADLLAGGDGVGLLVVPPGADQVHAALAAASIGQSLIVVPAVADASRVASALGRAGATVARWPGGTAAALAGHTIVGGNTAVLAPLPDLAAVVVLDEHDPRHQREASPTWHAREVALERARRAGVPALLVSPMPSLEAIDAAGPGGVREADRAALRAGWGRVDVVDRRGSDPREGLFSPRFVAAARAVLDDGHVVVCMLNRTGRARLLACGSCGLVAACEACGAAVRSLDGDTLECTRCGVSRPRVCLGCAGHAMKVLRSGVTRAREDLAALLRVRVGLVTAAEEDLTDERVVIGTEAVLNRHRRSMGDTVGLVCMLDFDQELLAPRYRAAEDALDMLVRASRLVGGRDGRIVVQTRDPHHEVLTAALNADPWRVATAERSRRRLLSLPPEASVAAVGGEAAQEWIERLGKPSGVEVRGPTDGWWLVRAPDPEVLAEVAGAVERPPGRLRLRVDPMSLPG